MNNFIKGLVLILILRNVLLNYLLLLKFLLLLLKLKHLFLVRKLKLCLLILSLLELFQIQLHLDLLLILFFLQLLLFFLFLLLPDPLFIQLFLILQHLFVHHFFFLSLLSSFFMIVLLQFILLLKVLVWIILFLLIFFILELHLCLFDFINFFIIFFLILFWLYDLLVLYMCKLRNVIVAQDVLGLIGGNIFFFLIDFLNWFLYLFFCESILVNVSLKLLFCWESWHTITGFMLFLILSIQLIQILTNFLLQIRHIINTNFLDFRKPLILKTKKTLLKDIVVIFSQKHNYAESGQ